MGSGGPSKAVPPEYREDEELRNVSDLGPGLASPQLWLGCDSYPFRQLLSRQPFAKQRDTHSISCGPTNSGQASEISHKERCTADHTPHQHRPFAAMVRHGTSRKVSG